MAIHSTTTTSPEPKLWLQIVKGFLTAAGILSLLFSLLFSFLMILGMIVDRTLLTPDNSTIAFSLALVGGGLGGILAWQAGNAFLSRASAVLRLPPVWVLVLIYIPVLGIGQALLSFDLLPVLTFPVFHALAALLPSLAILAYVVRGLRQANFRWREMVVQVSSGAFLSLTVALTLEIVFGLLIIVVVFVIAALLPGGLETLEELTTNLQNPLWINDPDNLLEVILYPPVIISLGLIFIILAPLVEEFTKLLGVAAMTYRQPSLARAFGWGIASGAGLGLIENFFNTITSLEMWVFVMSMRIGATLMHCLASGITAMGWQRTWQERRAWPLLRGYGVSVFIHAAWNALVIGIAGISVIYGTSASQTELTLPGLVVLVLIILLVLLIVGMVVGFVMIVRRLRQTLPSASTTALQ